MLAHISRYERLTGDGAAHPPTKDAVLESGALRLDPATRRAWFREQEVALTNKEFELLYFLASNTNKVFTRDQLLDEIWGYEFYGDSRTVDVHIKRIREKIEINPKNPKYLKVVWGLGYKMEKAQ